MQVKRYSKNFHKIYTITKLFIEYILIYYVTRTVLQY